MKLLEAPKQPSWEEFKNSPQIVNIHNHCFNKDGTCYGAYAPNGKCEARAKEAPTRQIKKKKCDKCNQYVE